ncbi:MAG TPA: hypothetical protein VK624_17825 [Steroidobacteraceae bacterium]|jgi:hypothetical protein|nr:hypothetical protein [Steroidobacteraceae bacterium]
MRLLLIGCLLLVLASCAAIPPARPPVKIGEEFTLALGESVGIEQKNVIVKFEKVIEDSRCPMNARCVWEGNARIALRASDAVERRYELNTSTRFNTREKIADFVIELRRLEPDRLAGAPTKGYVATLFVGAP